MCRLRRPLDREPVVGVALEPDRREHLLPRCLLKLARRAQPTEITDVQRARFREVALEMRGLHVDATDDPRRAQSHDAPVVAGRSRAGRHGCYEESHSPPARIILATTEDTEDTEVRSVGIPIDSSSVCVFGVLRGGAFSSVAQIVQERGDRFRNDPAPTRPTNCPSSITTRPCDRTVSAAPVTRRPS